MDLRQALTLYSSHFLSTWSARSYEFAAILFTASAFPGGLRAASLVGVANSIAAILFGAAIGRWIDLGQSRLRPLIATIFINKGAIIIACIFWQFIIQEKARPADDREAEIQDEDSASVLKGTPKLIAFGFILLLGLVESLSRKANLIAIERNWVPALAPPTVMEGRTLVQVNAMMGRIDMACKMLAPVAVSQFLVLVSPKTAALLFSFGNLISWVLEYTTAERLYKMSEELQVPNSGKAYLQSANGLQQVHFRPQSTQLLAKVIDIATDYVNNFRNYFRTEVWAASLAMCITHGSILSLTGVTVVFFLDSGYSMQLITIAETISAFCEFSSTFITPFAVQKISDKVRGSNGEQIDMDTVNCTGPAEEAFSQAETEPSATTLAVNTGLTHTGLYGIGLMLTILLPTVPLLIHLTSALFYPMARYSTNKSPTFSKYPFTSILLLGTLALSRVGRGVFSLTTQQLGQSRVAPEYRSTFAGVEMSFISLLGLGHNVGTAIFSDPRDFGVLATASWISLLCSMLLYLWWMKREGVAWAWWKATGKGLYQQIDNGG